MKIRWMVLAAALMMGQGAAAGPKVVEIVTPGLRVMGALTPQEAQEYVEKLRLFRRVVYKIANDSADPGGAPVELHVIPRNLWKHMGRDVSAYMKSTPDNARIFLEDSAGTAGLTVTYQVLAAYLLRGQGSAPPEPWYVYGVGGVMRNTEIKGNEAKLTVPLNMLGYMRLKGDWMPVEQVLGKDWSDYDERGVQQFYITSWALLHYGLVENKEFGRGIPRYIQARAQQKTIATAAQEAFGMNLEQLNTTIRDYARQDSMSELTLKFKTLPAPEILSSRTLDDTDSTVELAALLLRESPGNKKAVSMLEDVLKKHPEHARAGTLLKSAK